MQTLKRWWGRFQQTSVWLAWKRYGDSRGSLLAGGVGYFAFFSVFPAVLLAFTVFGVVLRNEPELLSSVKDSINELLPGFVKTASNPQGIIDVSAPSAATLSVSGITSVLGLVWAGTGWLGALRDAIRQIFRVQGAPGNFVLVKLRDIGVLVLLGVAILVSAAVGSIAGSAAKWLAGLVGLGEQGWILTVVAVLVGVAIDSVIIMLMLRVLSGVTLPWRAMRNAAIFGGVGLTVLKKLGSVLIAGTADKPLFAAFAAVVGLLVWLNFISRVILISTAWAANDRDRAAGALDVGAGHEHKATEGPEEQRLTTVRERTDAGLPTFGQRTADRTSLAAGAVLGAVGAYGLAAAGRGIRALRRRG